jgi:hypothetical protein
MSRTWRRDDSGRKQDRDLRREKKKQKANSHYEDIASDYERFANDRNSRNSNRYYDLDTDTD